MSSETDKGNKGNRGTFILVVAAIVAMGAAIFIVAAANRGTCRLPADYKGITKESPIKKAMEGENLGGWANIQTGPRLHVKAEEVKKLVAKMELVEDLDNKDVRDKDGKRAKVKFVRVKDESYGETEKDKLSESKAHFDLEVEKGGKYYAWARVWWLDSCGDSIKVLLQHKNDEEPRDYLVMDGTHEVWHWLPLTAGEAVELKEGAYTVTVENREDGARLSRILFTTKDYETYKPETPEG